MKKLVLLLSSLLVLSASCTRNVSGVGGEKNVPGFAVSNSNCYAVAGNGVLLDTVVVPVGTSIQVVFDLKQVTNSDSIVKTVWSFTNGKDSLITEAGYTPVSYIFHVGETYRVSMTTWKKDNTTETATAEFVILAGVEKPVIAGRHMILDSIWISAGKYNVRVKYLTKKIPTPATRKGPDWGKTNILSLIVTGDYSQEQFKIDSWIGDSIITWNLVSTGGTWFQSSTDSSDAWDASKNLFSLKKRADGTVWNAQGTKKYYPMDSISSNPKGVRLDSSLVFSKENTVVSIFLKGISKANFALENNALSEISGNPSIYSGWYSYSLLVPVGTKIIRFQYAGCEKHLSYNPTTKECRLQLLKVERMLL